MLTEQEIELLTPGQIDMLTESMILKYEAQTKTKLYRNRDVIEFFREQAIDSLRAAKELDGSDAALESATANALMNLRVDRIIPGCRELFGDLLNAPVPAPNPCVENDTLLYRVDAHFGRQ